MKVKQSNRSKKNRSKKEKLIRLSILIVAFITILGISTYILVKAMSFVFKQTSTTKEISVVYHNIHSHEIKHKLEQFVEKEIDSIKQTAFDPESFYKKLKCNFKNIKKITWNKTLPGKINLSVFCVLPEYLVNDNYILGNKKRMFLAKDFALCNQDALKKIYVAQNVFDEKMSVSVYEFLQKIPNMVWDRYTIRYEGAHKIILQERGAGMNKMLIIDRDTMNDAVKLARIDSIQDDFSSRTSSPRLRRTGRRKQRIVFDLRFKDRVYVSTRYREFAFNGEDL